MRQRTYCSRPSALTPFTCCVVCSNLSGTSIVSVLDNMTLYYYPKTTRTTLLGCLYRSLHKKYPLYSCSILDSLILNISVVPFQVHYYSEALPTTALILCWS